VTTADLSRAPENVTVEWEVSPLGAHYREASPEARPSRVLRRASLKGVVATAGAAATGVLAGVVLLAHGVSHDLARVTFEGGALAVIAGVLLDRVAPRVRARTEVRFTEGALVVRQFPSDDVVRIAHGEVVGFEVVSGVEPLGARPTAGYQVHAKLKGERVEVVFPAISERAEAEWLREFLAKYGG
jgi:hypothetical protein